AFGAFSPDFVPSKTGFFALPATGTLGNFGSQAGLILRRCATRIAALILETESANRGPCHAELGPYVSHHRADRRRFGLRRNRRSIRRNRQDHLLYCSRAVPGLGRGRCGPRTNPRVAELARDGGRAR